MSGLRSILALSQASASSGRTNPGCYELLEAKAPCNHSTAFKGVNADGYLECDICTRPVNVKLREPPTNEELLAERIHFQTDLSWNDLVALHHAMKIASHLPILTRDTRDTRDVVDRLITGLDNAQLDLPY
jgi:hypothetical protein